MMNRYRLPRQLSQQIVNQFRHIFPGHNLSPRMFMFILDGGSFLRHIPRIFGYKLGIPVWEYHLSKSRQNEYKFGKLFRLKTNQFLIPSDHYIYNDFLITCSHTNSFHDRTVVQYAIPYDNTLAELFQIFHNCHIDITNIMLTVIQNNDCSVTIGPNFDIDQVGRFINECRIRLSEL